MSVCVVSACRVVFMCVVSAMKVNVGYVHLQPPVIVKDEPNNLTVDSPKVSLRRIGSTA